MDLHHAIGIHDVRRRPEEQPVENAEHRRIRAQPQGERDDDRCRETGTQSQSARGVCDVVIESIPPPGEAGWSVGRRFGHGELSGRGVNSDNENA